MVIGGDARSFPTLAFKHDMTPIISCFDEVGEKMTRGRTGV